MTSWVSIQGFTSMEIAIVIFRANPRDRKFALTSVALLSRKKRQIRARAGILALRAESSKLRA